jgi:UDP-N-acetylglucosamine 4,6-dehydratase/UDP-glucose 4-epimerase
MSNKKDFTMISIEKDKKYLVTGGSGFLGIPLVQYILSCGGQVRVMSRNEGKLVELKEKFPSVEIYAGDVSDAFEVRQAMSGINGVFHLAASKHVGLAETFVRENVKTNTIGSLHILEQSLHTELDFVLAISTDKAAQVSGVYGATKLLMERLFKQYESLNPSCQYRIVRYGNVLYSTGSVLCKWKELITQGKEVIVTEPMATRFFWSVDQAIQLIIDCMKNANDSQAYCPNMKSMSIKNLLQAMIEKYSNGQDIPVRIIGLQPGENLHEKVLEAGPYSNEVEEFTIEEIKKLI